MHPVIDFEEEEDGRWVAEIPTMPGVMVYAASKEEAQSKVEALARRVEASQVATARHPQS